MKDRKALADWATSALPLLDAALRNSVSWDPGQMVLRISPETFKALEELLWEME